VVSGLAAALTPAPPRRARRRRRTVAVLGQASTGSTRRGTPRLAGESLRAARWSPSSPRAEPEPWHFPLRNRVISASRGCRGRRGRYAQRRLVTADMALEQAREVFAVPGPVTAPPAPGRIASSARAPGSSRAPATSSSLPDLARDCRESRRHTAGEVSGPERRLLDAMGEEPLPIDDIIRAARTADADRRPAHLPRIRVWCGSTPGRFSRESSGMPDTWLGLLQ